MVQITPADQDLPSKNFLVYADSGAGKTVFSASAKRVLFIAPEDNGIISAVNLGYRPDKIKVQTWSDFVAAYDYCYDNIDELIEKYDWFAIDSTTKMQEICLKEILTSQRAARISKEQDPDVPQMQDYQKLYILVERLILAFNDLPINVIYTALAANKEDPDGNEFLLPMIGSNSKDNQTISMKCASHMTSYGYLKVEVVDKPAPTPEDPTKTKKIKQRVIYWEDTGTYRGKDRTTRLQPKTVLPTKFALQYVSDLADGKIDRSGEPVNATKAPAKKAPAKKVAPHSGVPVESGSPAKTAPKVAEQSPNEPTPENINNPDVPTNTQHKEESEGIELASVEA